MDRILSSCGQWANNLASIRLFHNRVEIGRVCNFNLNLAIQTETAAHRFALQSRRCWLRFRLRLFQNRHPINLAARQQKRADAVRLG